MIEAADVIPEIHFSATKQRVAEVGICEAHKTKLFPEALFEASGGGRKAARRSNKPRGDAGHARTYKRQELEELPEGAKGLTAKQVGKAVGLGAAGVIYHQRAGHLTPVGKVGNKYLYPRSAIKTLRDLIANKGRRISAATRGKPRRKAATNAHSRSPKTEGLREVEPGRPGWLTAAQVGEQFKLTSDQLRHQRNKGTIVAEGYFGNQYMFSQKAVDAFAALQQQ